MKLKLKWFFIIVLGLATTSCGSGNGDSSGSATSQSSLFASSGQASPTPPELQGIENQLLYVGVRFVMAPGIVNGQQMLIPRADESYYLSHYIGDAYAGPVLLNFLSQAQNYMAQYSYDWMAQVYTQSKIDVVNGILSR